MGCICKFSFFCQPCISANNKQNFVRQLKNSGAPIQPIITLRKLKTTMPSLKPPVPKLLKSKVVYQVTCPRCNSCYVGWTHRHVGTRFSEHRIRWKQPVRPHFYNCIGSQPTTQHLKVLKSTTRSIDFLMTLEALYIREIHPSFNTKDEFISRELTIKFV